MLLNPHRLTATLDAIQDIAPDVRLFTIRPDRPVAFELGSHIDINLETGGKKLRRSYSLIGETPVNGAVQIAVKLADASRGGSKAMWALAPGATLSISPPVSNFPLGFNAPAYLLMAGGIGVTPILGMARRLKRLGTDVAMVYGGRSRASMPFLDELSGLLGERLSVAADDEGKAIDIPGAIAALPAAGELYVCGPSGMLNAVRDAWAASGRPATLLRFETFGDSGSAQAEAFTVRLADHDGREIAVADNQSIVEALRQSGIPMVTGCERGECGLCLTKVVGHDHAIDHRDVFLSPEEKAASEKLCPCVSRSKGTVTIDTGYRKTLV